MSTPDYNLLVTLDVLLAEGSVARAARRLRLSPSAMSRALARLRETTGDPLLVRAGRGLVPTPRAIELRERVAQLVQDGAEVLRPARKPNLPSIVRRLSPPPPPRSDAFRHQADGYAFFSHDWISALFSCGRDNVRCLTPEDFFQDRVVARELFDAVLALMRGVGTFDMRISKSQIALGV